MASPGKTPGLVSLFARGRQAVQRVGAAEIHRILAVTDALGVHREAVSIPLAARGMGSVRVTPARRLEIVVPAGTGFEAWLAGLPGTIQGLDLSAVQRAG